MNSIIERGDNVTVPIVGLKEWANDKAHKDHDPHALRLFLAGHLLPKDEPSLIELEQGYVNFQLTPLSGASDADEKKAWLQIFTEARRQEGGRVSITVGLPKDLQPFYSESFISVRVYPPYTPYVVAGLAVLLVALGCWAGNLTCYAISPKAVRQNRPRHHSAWEECRWRGGFIWWSLHMSTLA